MKTLKYWNILFTQFFAGLIFLHPEILISQEYTISYTVQDICACDIDLDNDQDLIVCSANDGLTPDTLYIFYNDGSGNFSKTAINRTNRIHVICGNVDDDQFPDIITAGNGNILFIKNNGDGTFGEEIAIAPSEGYKAIEYIVDMDVDGLNDLVYTYNAFYCKWGILRNEGDLLFTDHIIYNDDSGTNLSPDIGTLNNDNLPDACLEFTTHGIHVLINDGDLSFDSSLLCSTKGYVTICNLDFKSPQDILVFGPNTDRLILYESLGNNMFLERNTFPLIDALVPNVADFNNDGYDDLGYSICWWTGCIDSIYIRMNDQNWNFYKPQQYYVGPMDTFISETVDLNGDNFNDIIIYGYSPWNAFKILWNDGFGGFSYENPVGIKENFNQSSKIKVNISPNPFSISSIIKITSTLNSELQISLTDMLGQPVKQFNTIMICKDEPIEIFLDGPDDKDNVLKNGFYLLNVTDNTHNNSTIKVIIY